MTYTRASIQSFLANLAPFDRLPTSALEQLAKKVQLLRYRIGQTIVAPENMPAYISILYEGKARLIASAPQSLLPETLQLLQSGAILGWVSLVRGVPCETAIASTESICLAIPAIEFQTLLQQESDFAKAFDRCDITELFELLGVEFQRQARGDIQLKALTLKLIADAIVLTVPRGDTPLSHLDPNLCWLLSGGDTNFAVGSRLHAPEPGAVLRVKSASARVIGIPNGALSPAGRSLTIDAEPTAVTINAVEIPYAPDHPSTLDSTPSTPSSVTEYPYVSGKGAIDSTLACFQMLSQYWQMPFRRDIVRRTLVNQYQRMNTISLQSCGAIAELIGLSSQFVKIPATAISRLPTPALVQWQDTLALLYKTSEREVVLAIPNQGIERKSIDGFIQGWGETGNALLLQPTKETPRQRFGIRWFLPLLRRYRRILIEVLIASFVIQIFTLANPLITQVIIDNVLVKNGANSLNILGTLLIVIAIFEALLTSLRTTLFVDTTNRIDLTLGAEVIDHLLRLPLRYFEKRPVGELSTRINELENIRQFLTGTALTVVLDAIFSVIYIIVMVLYSPLLTLVALATVPLFALLTYTIAPIIREQLRIKAERYAETQSYLVEVIGGIQTVKAQNLELRSRWQWQQRYTRYIGAGFRAVLTSTAASSLSNFLNKLSGLLLLWVGAYLVLQSKLSLGQLIAFRIIAGYTTSPLLRLIQLWQNFQETALSLERLSDILDTPREVETAQQQNIPMPDIKGVIKYENVCFRFNNSPTLQLNNINLELPAGAFVGVVGQSGAGKSTLTKVIPQLYDLESGRILIDGYNIHKVELYSLRQQIGMVLQDTLLFDTTIQENIALTNSDATSENIIEAARIAYAHDFIMDLPDGYNTRVGERGAALSGGQRQRIAIARTVLQKPRLLILDEATSALDYHSERQVCQNLALAFKGRTVFFITHRLATIQHATVILMMDRGTIAEQGTHEELIARKGLYYSLYQQQATQLN